MLALIFLLFGNVMFILFDTYFLIMSSNNKYERNDKKNIQILEKIKKMISGKLLFIDFRENHKKIKKTFLYKKGRIRLWFYVAFPVIAFFSLWLKSTWLVFLFLSNFKLFFSWKNAWNL